MSLDSFAVQIVDVLVGRNKFARRTFKAPEAMESSRRAPVSRGRCWRFTVRPSPSAPTNEDGEVVAI